ncbi:MAG: hemerythrin domain-containing protein [Myxococcota bacterium]
MSVDLSLPREAWTTHPHYPSQVLLLRSHASFRSISRQLIDGASRGVERDALLEIFRWWKASMRSHEAYEEGKLYPFLTRRFGIDTAPMAEGHDALRTADLRVRAASDTELQAALEHHDTVLDVHLDLEESIVIPALLALEPEEFEAYLDGR